MRKRKHFCILATLLSTVSKEKKIEFLSDDSLHRRIYSVKTFLSSLLLNMRGSVMIDIKNFYPETVRGMMGLLEFTKAIYSRSKKKLKLYL